ncbi:MAG: hypothetical protein KME30_04680 [Iphinoe sp. HA4291-MV1]|nr:hypothetical protein [Iphinoe sp. HA4291-MV1]
MIKKAQFLTVQSIASVWMFSDRWFLGWVNPTQNCLKVQNRAHNFRFRKVQKVQK